MSQAHSATGLDRLPWLDDEPVSPQGRNSNRDLVGWAVAAALIVAAASYWIGAHSLQEETPVKRAAPEITVPLPEPREAEPAPPEVLRDAQPEVSPIQEPEVRPVAQSEVRIARPMSVRERADRAPARQSATTRSRTQRTPPPPPAVPVPPPRVQAQPVVRDQPLTAWPAWQSQGAAGRIVRIGAFGSRQQAKLGWRYMVNAYPAVAHLRATVIETRNSRGRRFYRLQIGTTSQAHSEVLCQRMDKIRLSCAVVGLPWKPKGVER